MSSLCPFCPFTASEGKGGVIRTDSVRRHVLLKHASVDYNYVDKGGYSMEKLSDAIIIKYRVINNHTTYSFGFCKDCNSYIRLEGHHHSRKKDVCLSHSCKEKQTRERRVPRDPSKPPKPPKQINFTRILKARGFDDYIEHDDDCELDVDKTMAEIQKAFKKGVSATPPVGSIIERIRGEKQLEVLKIDELVQEAHDTIADDSDAEAYEEFECVLKPLFIKAANYITVRTKMSQNNNDLRAKVSSLESDIEDLKIKLALAEKENAERFIDPRFITPAVNQEDVITHVEDVQLPKINQVSVLDPSIYGGF